MARFDIYKIQNETGYVLDIQADLLDALNTRIVVPLMPFEQAPKPANRLNPVFDIQGEAVVMVTQFMSAVPFSILNSPVGSLSSAHIEITNAIDMVLQGF